MAKSRTRPRGHRRAATPRALRELETVQATSLETFKSAVAAALAPPLPPAPPRATGDRPFVFLNTEPRHGEIAAKIRAAIGSQAILAEPLRAGTAEEVRVDLEQNLIDCDAMVMVYVDNPGWARAQLRAFLKAAPRRDRLVRAIPVIDAPAEPKPELNFTIQKWSSSTAAAASDPRCWPGFRRYSDCDGDAVKSTPPLSGSAAVRTRGGHYLLRPRAMLDRLGRHRLLAVTGSSGCGKSSLVRAGLLEALETGLLATAGPMWRVAALRPGGQPMTVLAAALIGALGGSQTEDDVAMPGAPGSSAGLSRCSKSCAGAR